jgi:hypothetical protein
MISGRRRRKLRVPAIFLCLLALAGGAGGAVTWTIYEDYPVTPYDGHDVFTGTTLTIFVHSDSNEPSWLGYLALLGEDRFLGILSGRGPQDDFGNWLGSMLPAAGEDPTVQDWVGETGVDGQGFILSPGWDGGVGDWFVIDYTATEPGDPNIAFYNPWTSWSNPPTEKTTVHQVATRDFTKDKVVNLEDFALLASRWLQNNCNGPDWCQKTDLDRDGDVDVVDLAMFAEYWLTTN